MISKRSLSPASSNVESADALKYFNHLAGFRGYEPTKLRLWNYLLTSHHTQFLLTFFNELRIAEIDWFSLEVFYLTYLDKKYIIGTPVSSHYYKNPFKSYLNVPVWWCPEVVVVVAAAVEGEEVGVEVVAVGEVRLLPHLRIRRLTTRQVLENQMFYIKSFYRRNGLAMEHFSRRRWTTILALW